MYPLYDCHVHSLHSHDSMQSIDQICRSALNKGLRGVAITDHADIWFLEQDHTFEHIAASATQAREEDLRQQGRLRVFSGLELSEYQDGPEQAEKLLRLCDYDVVLASVHSLRFEQWDDSYSRICFDESVPLEKIYAFLQLYFAQVLDMAQHEDFDVLTHLTCPVRYINGKYGRGVTLARFAGVIEEILRCLIKRDKALEVNTSGLGGMYQSLMPDEDILEQYHDLGGRLLTLASDAHTPDRLGNAFVETGSVLQRLGFAGYYFYEKRTPCKVDFTIE